MRSCYSILKFVNNPLSDESIAIGLLAISNNEIYYATSSVKIAFAKTLNKNFSKLLEFALKQFDNFIAEEKEKTHVYDIAFKIDNTFLNKLSNYHNGILQFTKPFYLDINIDQFLFEKYFKKFVFSLDVEIESKPTVKKSLFKKNISNKIHLPLRGKIDIDYTIHKKELPTLFFDFDFDAIGINGSVYAVKAIDINTIGTSSFIERTISEYESIIERLNDFASKNNIRNNNPCYYLMMDKYVGKKKEIEELYNFISNEKMPLFELISSENGDVFSKTIIKTNAQKFSSLLHSE